MQSMSLLRIDRGHASNRHCRQPCSALLKPLLHSTVMHLTEISDVVRRLSAIYIQNGIPPMRKFTLPPPLTPCRAQEKKYLRVHHGCARRRTDVARRLANLHGTRRTSDLIPSCELRDSVKTGNSHAARCESPVGPAQHCAHLRSGRLSSPTTPRT
ncbi:uncharacterized protein M421DRAFT_152752 [Didymella exigua CBS 183.55]|uniref:Uncharacterized protein n=1 Tax=Didymella exigua CBS 183.55 TaxID=1150837 RepID=A0A6A5RMN6_9PLEO|nr:uncharacterized protein M421DRAFT_152752 [Didymella exigua CBS 183.55]KAF1928693.1 hypothetical protein M421DRAFT_152752 [Didymella exigua CBS 183.55]